MVRDDQLAVTQEQHPGQVTLDGMNAVLLIDMIWSSSLEDQ